MDGDLIPDVPVGRIPARTPEQAAVVVEKILAFERRQPTIEDLRFIIWTGASGLGAASDTVATGFLLSCVRLSSPSWAHPWIICSDANSPFCGAPPDQPVLFNRAVKQGCALAAMMGHGSRGSFSCMRFENRALEYTARHAREGMAEGEPTAPLVFFSCSIGDFTGRSPCLAESLLFLPGGPVATVGATTESHPLTNYFSALCLMQALSGNDRRFGSLWLGAQLKAMKARSFVVERVLRHVEGKLEKEINVDRLKRDQILMYTLFGDPATSLKLPYPLTASVRRKGSGWHWKAARPEGATALHVGFRSDLTPAALVDGDLQENEADARFRAANATFAYAALPGPAADEPWEGTCDRQGWLRLVAIGPGRLWVAALKLELPPPHSLAPD